MISPGYNAFRVTSDKHIGAHFEYCQINIHIQTARESFDLNMDFRSFDNGFKLLRITNFMQECSFLNSDVSNVHNLPDNSVIKR